MRFGGLIIRRGFAIRDRYDDGLRRVVPKPVRDSGGRKVVPKPPKVVKSIVVQERDELGPPPDDSLGASESVESGLECRWGLVGLANAGKSTLANSLLGKPLAAISSRAHTTRGSRVLGCVERGDRRAVLVDSAGFVGRRDQKHRERQLVDSPWLALGECDAGLLVVDASAGGQDTRLDELGERLQPWAKEKRLRVVLSKIDAVADGSAISDALEQLERLGLAVDQPLLVSGLRGTHVHELRDVLLERATEPGSELGWQGPGERWAVHEAVREGLFTELREEIPYGARVRIVGWSDNRAQVEIVFPKKSQVAVAVGRGGRIVRIIADGASARLTRLLGRPIELALSMRAGSGAELRGDYQD